GRFSSTRGLRGRGVLDIFALFRHRRPPRRPKTGGNGRWQEAVALGGQVPSVRSKGTAKSGPAKPRPRREAPAANPEAGEGYLAAHSMEKAYGGRKVVNGVNVYVRRGEAVGLLGPNGAGKTTAFYMITGLVKADRGQIELDGHDVTHLPMYQRARLGI